jgi:hypothetical protein
VLVFFSGVCFSTLHQAGYWYVHANSQDGAFFNFFSPIKRLFYLKIHSNMHLVIQSSRACSSQSLLSRTRPGPLSSPVPHRIYAPQKPVKPTVSRIRSALGLVYIRNYVSDERDIHASLPSFPHGLGKPMLPSRVVQILLCTTMPHTACANTGQPRRIYVHYIRNNNLAHSACCSIPRLLGWDTGTQLRISDGRGGDRFRIYCLCIGWSTICPEGA